VQPENVGGVHEPSDAITADSKLSNSKESKNTDH